MISYALYIINTVMQKIILCSKLMAKVYPAETAASTLIYHRGFAVPSLLYNVEIIEIK